MNFPNTTPLEDDEELMTMSLPANINEEISKTPTLDSGLELIETRLQKLNTNGRPKSLLPKPESKPIKANVAASTNRPKPDLSTSSMLRSTLKRINRLSMATKPSPIKSEIDPSGTTKPKDRLSISNKPLNNASLKRPTRKEPIPSSVNKRSQSMRRARDKDLLVRKSRGIQTSLTKDTFEDLENENGNNNIEFSLFLPDLLGNEEEVETIVTEHTDPPDVRKNRHLTLENLRLSREVDRLKHQVIENDHLKKELKNVRSKLEEESRSRMGIEKQLDNHNSKVKKIVASMDSVEKEFENQSGAMIVLENSLEAANKELDSTKTALKEAILHLNYKSDEVRILLARRAETEAETADMHEFLQAEKATVVEAFKDLEIEVAGLKKKAEEKELRLINTEDRLRNIITLESNRRREIESLESQLNAVQERAKDMILLQGSEISRASVSFAELSLKLENIFLSRKSPKRIKGPKRVIKASLNTSLPATMPLEEDEESISVGSKSLMNISLLGSAANGIDPENNGDLKKSHINFRIPSLSDRIIALNESAEKFRLNLRNAHKCKCEFGNPEIQDENEVPNSLDISLKNNANKNNNREMNEVIEEKDAEISNLKSTIDRFIRHREILQFNWEQSEAEVQQVDAIYHETIEEILAVFKTNSEIVNSNKDFLKLKANLESNITDSREGKTKVMTNSFNHDLNANQSL